MTTQRRTFITIAVLLTLLLFQLGHTKKRVYWGWRTALRVLPRHGIWRSVRFSAGAYTADFTMFLRAYVPRDADVTLPPPEDDVPPYYRHPSLVSWVILPRRLLLNCATEACVARQVRYKSTYVPWFRPQLPAGLTPDFWLPYNHERGLLVPAGASLRAVPEAEGWPVLIWRLLLAGGILLGWWLAGGTLLRWFSRPRFLPLEAQGALAWVIGAAFAAVVFLAGLALNVAPRAAAVGVILLSWGLGWSTARRLVIHAPGWLQQHGRTAGFWLGLGLAAYLLGLAFLGWAKGYHTSDAISIWACKGYALVDVGWEGLRLCLYRDYPVLIPALIGIFRALAQDSMVESKWIFGLFALALGLWIYGRLRRNVGARWAALGTALAITTPWYTRHAMIGYANLAFALLVVMAASWPLSSPLHLPALLLALAVWVRPEGLYVAGLVAMARLLALRGAPFARTQKIVWFVPYVLSAGLWKWAHHWLYPNRRISEEMLRLIAEHWGDIRPLIPALGQVLSFAWHSLWVGKWGYLGPAMLFLLFLASLQRGWTREALWITATGLMIISTYALLYAFFFFDGGEEALHWWLSTGFERMISSGVLAMWLGLWLALRPTARPDSLGMTQ